MGQEGREGGVNGSGLAAAERVRGCDARRLTADLYDAALCEYGQMEITMCYRIACMSVVVSMKETGTCISVAHRKRKLRDSHA